MKDFIVQSINLEIDRLTEARDLLIGGDGHLQKRANGRRRRKPMSAETKAKIAAAMAKTWAKRKKK